MAELWAVKAMIGMNWFSLSTLLVYLPVFYSAYFDKVHIGILTAIPCLCYVLAPPIWGAIADILHQQRNVHIFCLITGAMAMYFIQYASMSFALTASIVFIANFQTNPTVSLLDQAVMALLRRVGGEYGKQRLFGAIGWGVGAFVTGIVVNSYGISWAFIIHLVCVVPKIILLQRIPPPESTEQRTKEHGQKILLDGLIQASQRTDLILLSFVVFVLGFLFGTISSFLGLNLFELSENSTSIVGIAISIETFSELPAFFFADAIVQRLGIVLVLFISICGYAIRLMCYAFMTTATTALPFELLHGVTFALAWTACTQYIYDAAPPGTEGTMMGLLNAIMHGLGRGTGTLLGGYLYETYGAQTMWLTASAGVPFALVALVLFAYTTSKRAKHEVHVDDEHNDLLSL